MTSQPLLKNNAWVGGEPSQHAAPRSKSEPRIGNFMQVYSGKQFWPMSPRAAEVDIDDIAHSLSLQCRYAGHCLRFYSVAEHSVHVANWLRQQELPPRTVMQGLLHDASEAYLVDVPRPVKPFLPGYAEAEVGVMAAVAERFNIDLVLDEKVLEADNRILLDERAQNMAPGNYAGGWPELEPLGIELRCWSPAAAKEEFIETYWSLVEAAL